ncbi:hypothetical protein AAC387_Pa10g0682 [Persea americana]
MIQPPQVMKQIDETFVSHIDNILNHEHGTELEAKQPRENGPLLSEPSPTNNNVSFAKACEVAVDDEIPELVKVALSLDQPKNELHTEREYKFILAGNDNTFQKLTLSQAIDTRDALAKYIYASLFDCHGKVVRTRHCPLCSSPLIGYLKLSFSGTVMKQIDDTFVSHIDNILNHEHETELEAKQPKENGPMLSEPSPGLLKHDDEIPELAKVALSMDRPKNERCSPGIVGPPGKLSKGFRIYLQTTL